ncbi:Uncharacterized protein OS=Crinalium epipsammum PCC 9333 GN=Cri9333_0093 PE=4 SV=1: DUF2382 [Gemmataceae bacterium]|nr:Uncharacterized protein OS=Crinalium epipsammum PCC 9333 GN=Cri9333_0093 PE=4 SV=1: DUF2382 [Gemmataceae bacterium]VTU00462.1 Uncharacterized protein OS=Crinalium epipsammum PCC 9333 GN=Cri9333_0093 PE=4 SV=1: DUF2382 [Gemmataceae bacterium]
MASNKNKDPEKTVDVPPYGSRNPDPVTDSPGSHPIETGIGALVGGAASGAAVGAVGGPVGAVVGAIVGGGLAGGLAGKGVGELIDPTTEDNWIREYAAKSGSQADPDISRPAYRYGIESGSKYTGRRFEDVEPDLRSGWEASHAKSGVAWDQARGAVRDAFDRTIKLHEERLNVTKESVKTGEVGVRKEVVTEHKQITVPVEREEVVIERRPASGATTTGGIRAEEIRIPVKEEQVHVSKETVLKEEVTVGKRKVQDTKTVEGDVRREEVKVETEGKPKVRTDKK